MITRRNVVKTAAGIAILPSLATAVSAETQSGEVELTTTSTIPTNTTIEITAYEDLDGNGTADNTQTISISDGTSTAVYDQLQGRENEGVIYWFDVSLSTTDTSVTPTLDAMTVTLPAPATADSDPTGITLPMRINFLNMDTSIALFLVGILGTLLGATVALKNIAAGVLWGISLVLLFAAGSFGFGLELFWIGLIFTVLLLVVGMVVRWG